MLLDLIKSIATLHQYQREHDSAGGREVIFATTEDFRIACTIYQALNGESGGQSTKLTRHEAMLIADIRRAGRYEFTMKELVDISGKSYDAVRKLIRGNGTNGNHSGLLEKCPAITYHNRTDSSDRVSKTQLVYAWNDSMYEMWASGGKCWLDMSFVDRHDPDDGGSRTDRPERPESDRSATGENFSPVIPDRTTDDSQNNNNKNNFSTDRSNYPGAEQVSEPSPSYVSDPENLLRSSDRSDCDQTNDLTASVSETGADSVGASIPPEALQPPDFHSITIDPDDYSPIDGVWGGPCAVCGGKWVQYTEKFSAKMKEEGRFSHKICQKCYSTAVARVSLSMITLPGTINPTVMVPADKDYGRCSICDQGRVAWYDHESKTGICDICYSRERGRPGVMV